MSSLHKAGLQHAHLQMAVLCQPVIPAQYAFVAHTTNPVTGASLPCHLLLHALWMTRIVIETHCLLQLNSTYSNPTPATQ